MAVRAREALQRRPRLAQLPSCIVQLRLFAEALLMQLLKVSNRDLSMVEVVVQLLKGRLVLSTPRIGAPGSLLPLI